MHAHRLPQEETCPIPDSLLGEMYRANPIGLTALVQSVPSNVRAMLAIYCYPRAHLSPIALVIAASCEKEDLINFGGDLGAAMYEQARRSSNVVRSAQNNRRNVSLSSGAIMQIVIDQDLI
jgi:hypothetical protein